MQDNEKRVQHVEPDGVRNPCYAPLFRQVFLGCVNALRNKFSIHFRQKHWLIAIFLSWIILYFYSEKGEAERNLTIILELIYLIVSFCFVLFNSIKLKAKFSDTSFIVFVAMLISLFGSRSIVYHADMTAKSIYFYYFNQSCKQTNSDYLNRLGIKICYGRAYFPQAKIILLSPRIDLVEAINSHHNSIFNELSKENELFEWFVSCAPVEVNESLKKGIYYFRVFCQ